MPALPNDIWLGPADDIQLLSPFGRTLSRGYLPGLFREERAASGKYRRDIIARKELFRLSYNLADGDTVDRYIELFNLDDELTLKIQNGAALEEFQVLLQPFRYDRLMVTHDGLYEGLSVELIEI